jgi:hypothetical protein
LKEVLHLGLREPACPSAESKFIHILKGELLRKERKRRRVDVRRDSMVEFLVVPWIALKDIPHIALDELRVLKRESIEVNGVSVANGLSILKGSRGLQSR